MTVSIVEVYKKTGTDPEQHTLMPVTSNLEGRYRGEAIIDFGLMQILSAYRDAEENKHLEELEEHPELSGDKVWLKVLDAYIYTDKEKEEDREHLEYGVIGSAEKGYLEVVFWEGYRYFKPTEKCMNLDLYKHRTE